MADTDTDFGAALAAMREGKKVRRAAWAETTALRLSPQKPDSDPLFVFVEGEMESGRPVIGVLDVTATDWAVVEDAPVP